MNSYPLLLIYVLSFQRPHHILVVCASGDDVVDDHRAYALSLPPETGVELLVQLQRPSQPVPDHCRAALLQVQSMPAGCGM